MASSARRSMSRNYSGKSGGKDELDSALDDLGGLSYLDGIPFQLDRGIQSALENARIHMNKADALLATPLPLSLNQESNTDVLLADIGRVERQVLDQLKQIEIEREERKRKKDELIKNYEEQKENERKQALKQLKETQDSNITGEETTNATENTDVEQNSNCQKIDKPMSDGEMQHTDLNIPEEKNKISDKNQEITPDSNPSEETHASAHESSSHSSDISSDEISITSSQPPKSEPTVISSTFQQPIPTTTITSTSVTYLEPSRTTSSSNSIMQYPKNIQSKTEDLFNFSEFERESDPFEKAELQTLNDMQELAAVFPQSSNTETSHTSGVPVVSNPNLSMRQQHPIETKNSMGMAQASAHQSVTNQINPNTHNYSQPPHSVPKEHPNPTGQFSSYYQPMQGNVISHHQSGGSFYTQGVNTTHPSIISSNTTSSGQPQYHQNQIYQQHGTATPYIPPYQPPNLTSANDSNFIAKETDTSSGETLKSSKSVGDLMTEIQKETDDRMVASDRSSLEMKAKENVLKKSRAYSQTPPPSKNQTAENDGKFKKHNADKGRQSTFDDWIPWPDIDGLTTASSNPPPSPTTIPLNNPLEGLSQESSAKCKQLHDMGFPLDRLAKACKAIGNDDQQMINYCLLVDKILEDPTIAANPPQAEYRHVVEDVVLLHSLDEPKIIKHLESFGRLAEFGFEPPAKIHSALVECNLDYEKALEQMLK